jgi:hypothetical protein
VAHAIILLSTTPKQCCLYHVYNSHSQFLGDVVNELSSVDTNIRLVEQEEFDTAMQEASNDPVKAKSLSSMVAYQDMAHGKKFSDVSITNRYTTQVLHRLGFCWSPTSWDYIDQMLVAIGGLGYFDDKK